MQRIKKRAAADHPQIACLAAMPLFVGGAILLLSGGFHGLVWLLSGESWQGAISWRKPILFGVSGGVTLLSLGWLTQRLASLPFRRSLAWTTSIAMLFEVALLSIQQWRGVASHFNRTTAIDSTIESLMTLLISLFFLGVLYLSWFTLRDKSGSMDARIAWRHGIVYLLVSCLIGYVILILGNQNQTTGIDPARFGKAGILKFPHGVAIHAIQVLPFLSWIFLRLNTPEVDRVSAVRWTSAAVALLLIFSIVQTLGGRARLDVSYFSLFLLVGSVVCMMPVLGKVGRSLRKKLRLAARPFFVPE